MYETTAYFSGHANSGAMVARMHEIGTPPDRVVYAETGLEFEQVYDWMEKFERHLGIEIIRENRIAQNPKYEFFTYMNSPWIRGNLTGEIHGSPKTKNQCWHNRNVKEPVFKKYDRISSEVYIGFTVEERHRVLKKRLETHRYPLIEWQWTARDSRNYLKKIGLSHPMYEIFGFERLGCCICPKQNNKSLYLIYRHFPQIWEKILEMEDISPKGFRAPDKPTPYELMDQWDKSAPKVTLSDFTKCPCEL